jgi:hypothetical protein
LYSAQNPLFLSITSTWTLFWELSLDKRVHIKSCINLLLTIMV